MYGLYDGSEVIAELVAPLKVVSNRPIFVSDSLALGRRVTKRTAQRWEVETRLMPMSYGANDLFAFMLDSEYDSPLTLIVPQNVGAKLARTAASTVTATGAQGSTTVTLAGSDGLIPKGTFVKFAGQSKVYVTMSDRTGNGTINIFPELRAAVADAAMTYKDDVQMLCTFDTDTVIGMAYEEGWLMDLGTIKLIERV